jgi:NAD(P)-dependent dehydrogenase (short-subunit alcohol dehydrogenase family)
MDTQSETSRPLHALSQFGSAVVVGANGGIGGALVDVLKAKYRFNTTYAVSRNGQFPDPSVTSLSIDLTLPDTMAEAAQTIALGGPVSLAIVATGLLQDEIQSPEKSMGALEPDGMARAFAINAIGPALVAKHLLPLMNRSQPSVFAALSARVGSISDNRSGGWYSYRASKAALNMLIQTLSLEHARKHPLGVCVAIHPGTVDTRLSKPFQSGVAADRLFSPDKSAAHILNIIHRLNPSDSGGLFAWDGQRLAP